MATYTKLGNLPTGKLPSGNILSENSGFIVGRKNPGILFCVEDGIAGADENPNTFVYCLSLSDLSLVKVLTLTASYSLELGQWEDLAYNEGTQTIYVAQCGNNSGSAGDFPVYEFDEPTPTQINSGVNTVLSVAVKNRYMFRWGKDGATTTAPSGGLNCETMLCAPASANDPHRIYFVNKIGIPASYTKHGFWQAPSTLAAWPNVNSLTLVKEISAATSSGICAGDWCHDNSEITLIRNSSNPGMRSTTLKLNSSFVFTPETWAYQGARDVPVAQKADPVNQNPTNESLAYLTTGTKLVVGSEGAGSEVWQADYGTSTPPPGSVPTIGTLSSDTITTTSVKLNWTAAKADSGTPVTSYTLKRSGASNIVISNPATLTYTVTGLSASTAYSWTLTATNSVGESAASNAVAVTTLADPVQTGKTWKVRVGTTWKTVTPYFGKNTPEDPVSSNYLSNPSFETDQAGSAPTNWTVATSGAGSSLSVSSTSSALYGTKYAVFTSGLAASGTATIYSNTAVCAPGDVWSAGGNARWAVGPTARSFRVDVQYLDAAGVVLNSENGTAVTPTTNGWSFSAAETGVAAPANTTAVRLRAVMLTSSGTDAMHVDGFQLEKSATLPPYNPLAVTSMTPVWSDLVADAYGINVHPNFAPTASPGTNDPYTTVWDYRNFSSLMALTSGSGARYYRCLQTNSNAPTDTWIRNSYVNHGLRAHVTFGRMQDLYSNPGGSDTVASSPINQTSMDTYIDARFDKMIASGLSKYVSIGGVNEPNTTLDSAASVALGDRGNGAVTNGRYRYPDWWTQLALYMSRVKSRAVTKGWSGPIVAPALKWAEDDLADEYDALYDAGIADSVTHTDFHLYPMGNKHYNEPGGTGTLDDTPTETNLMQQQINWTKNAFGSTKPMYITELGFNNYGPGGDYDQGTAPPAVAGVYQPRMLLETVRRGFQRVFVYELMDDDINTDGDVWESWSGIVSVPAGKAGDPTSWVPKPAYTNTKKLIDLVTDAGATYTPTTIPLRITIPSGKNVRYLLTQKRDGTTILFLWQDEGIWNHATNSAVSVADVNVTLETESGNKVVNVGTTVKPVKLRGVLDVNGNPTPTYEVLAFP